MRYCNYNGCICCPYCRCKAPIIIRCPKGPTGATGSTGADGATAGVQNTQLKISHTHT